MHIISGGLQSGQRVGRLELRTFYILDCEISLQEAKAPSIQSVCGLFVRLEPIEGLVIGKHGKALQLKAHSEQYICLNTDSYSRSVVS